MTDDIMVSVLCTAYNHDKYIRECLDGFVSQKPSFRYECIVHDDASTDGTAAIIQEYAEKYPDIIKPIFQTVNQYSQGIRITEEYLVPAAQGKYIALCEGDDYWIDPLKLQKQVDAMEKHPECHMCVCKAQKISEDGSRFLGYRPNFELEEKVLSSEEFLSIIFREYAFHTSSYFFKAEDIRNYTHPVPEFCQVCPVGDEAYMLYFGQLGPIYYISDIMSCHRCGSIGGWNQRVLQNKKNYKEHLIGMAKTYEEYDKYTNGKYHDACLSKTFNKLLFAAESKEEFKALINYKDNLFRKLSVRSKTRILLGAYAPKVLKVYYRLAERN